MATLSDRDLVQLCVKELYAKMGYSENAKISQGELEHVCYLIEERTKIIISLSTIKRIISGKFERLPQLSTLDALTMFVGYAGWHDFKTRKNAENVRHPPMAAQPVPAQPPRKSAAIRYALLLCGTGLLVALVILASLPRTDKNREAVFSVKKVVSDDVPSNVIFNYNIDQLEGDSFFIQLSWNPKQRIAIQKNNYTRTETYYDPGYHTAKLISNDKVIKETVVHIPTRNWIGYSKVKFTDVYPEYFRSDCIVHNDVLGASIECLKESNIDIEKDKIYYYAYFPDSINVNSDNFRMKARMRMSTVKNTLCPGLIAEVYSENSFFYFMGTTPGCTSEIKALFSDQYLDGKTTDLSSFGYDVMNWQDVELMVKDRTVAVMIGGKKVFERPYTRPGGFIKGMGFGSNGLCEVDYVELQDSSGNVVYRNDFHTP